MFALALGSLVVVAVAVLVLRQFAPALGLVDRPGGRKTHDGEVPLVGGIAMFVAIALGVALIPASAKESLALIGGCSLLMAVGVADDRFDVRARGRLLAHFAAAVLAVAMFDGVTSFSLGRAFGTIQPLVLTDLSAVVVLMILVAGTVNAFNMVDGMDGLAGTLSAITLAGFAWVAVSAADTYAAQVCAVALGAVVGFLLFNLPVPWNRPWRVFMGDAGSTLLGFLAAVMALRLSQEARAMAPVTALWLAAIPVSDLLTAMVRRVACGQSPFKPDRAHFHHRLLDAGLTVPSALGLLSVVAAGLAAVGLWMHTVGVAEWVQLVAFVGTSAALAYATTHAARWVPVLPAWTTRDGRRASPADGPPARAGSGQPE